MRPSRSVRNSLMTFKRTCRIWLLSITSPTRRSKFKQSHRLQALTISKVQPSNKASMTAIQKMQKVISMRKTSVSPRIKTTHLAKMGIYSSTTTSYQACKATDSLSRIKSQSRACLKTVNSWHTWPAARIEQTARCGMI